MSFCKNMRVIHKKTSLLKTDFFPAHPPFTLWPVPNKHADAELSSTHHCSCFHFEISLFVYLPTADYSSLIHIILGQSETSYHLNNDYLLMQRIYYILLTSNWFNLCCWLLEQLLWFLGLAKWRSWTEKKQKQTNNGNRQPRYMIWMLHCTIKQLY